MRSPTSEGVLARDLRRVNLDLCGTKPSGPRLTRTARSLGLTQPSISKALKQLRPIVGAERRPMCSASRGTLALEPADTLAVGHDARSYYAETGAAGRYRAAAAHPTS